MPAKDKLDGPFNNSQGLLTWRYIFILIALTAPLIVCGGADVPATEEPAATVVTTSTPTPLSTATTQNEEAPGPEDTLPEFIEIAENSDVSTNDTLGQINVEYSVRLSPNSGDGSVIASVRIPEQLASLNPVRVEKVTIPENAPPIVGAQQSYEAVIRIARQMRIEMDAPSLLNISEPAELIQEVNIDGIDDPIFWLWTFKAPEDIGYHNFTLSVFLNEEPNPAWVRIFQIEVRDPATPVPAITPTPVPFIATPAGSATIIGGAIILVMLLVGFLIVGLRKNNVPIIGSINRRRNLQKQIAIHTRRLQLLKERQAQQGVNTDPATIIEIETIENELEQLKTGLDALDSD